MIKRGDIYFIRDTRQSIGSEQKADRPAAGSRKAGENI